VEETLCRTGHSKCSATIVVRALIIVAVIDSKQSRKLRSGGKLG
jgi:hypothetical protein